MRAFPCSLENHCRVLVAQADFDEGFLGFVREVDYCAFAAKSPPFMYSMFTTQTLALACAPVLQRHRPCHFTLEKTIEESQKINFEQTKEGQIDKETCKSQCVVIWLWG